MLINHILQAAGLKPKTAAEKLECTARNVQHDAIYHNPTLLKVQAYADLAGVGLRYERGAWSVEPLSALPVDLAND